MKDCHMILVKDISSLVSDSCLVGMGQLGWVGMLAINYHLASSYKDTFLNLITQEL